MSFVLATVVVCFFLLIFLLPFVAWFKFCTRHLGEKGKREARRNTIGNLIVDILADFPSWLLR